MHRQRTWGEEPGPAEHERCKGARPATRAIGRTCGKDRPGRGNPLPEIPEALDAPLRRIAGDDRGIDRADGDSGDPVREVVRQRERLVDAGLIAAERTAALEDESHPLVVGLGSSRHVGFHQSTRLSWRPLAVGSARRSAMTLVRRPAVLAAYSATAGMFAV